MTNAIQNEWIYGTNRDVVKNNIFHAFQFRLSSGLSLISDFTLKLGSKDSFLRLASTNDNIGVVIVLECPLLLMSLVFV